MLKKDAFIFGLIIGTVLPVLLYIVLYFGSLLLLDINVTQTIPDKETIMLISIFVNLFPIRYYFVNLKFDMTGRGVLLITFVLGTLFFIYKLNNVAG